ncbi:hypothetical protein GXM_07744 [Nostoc sphaeroides CCNUC1]|uniref:Uncharacterized protein n=1 Tax=Nostoc sphaeroides CCNUC1 TaxID=2653204 RepID=A0A5P8WCB2_9NOSO|nr:hypothetical protein GXM_07744 [Nostoc sphaeroides CCNUC1]
MTLTATESVVSGAEIFCADTLEKNPLVTIIAPNRGIIEAL